ncbi:MAG: CysZ protein [Saprospiraceae bacterium]|jgi:CysZ protein
MIVVFFRGIFSYVEAFAFILKAGLGRYFLYSGLIGLGILAVFGGIAYTSFGPLGSWILSWIPWDLEISPTLGSWVSFVLSSVLFFAIFKYLVLIFTAPIMSALSAKVEAEIDPYNARIESGSIISEISRGVKVSIRNVIRELSLTVLLLIFGLIPVLTAVSGPLILLVQSYFAGFGNLDLWAERHLSYRDTLGFMSENKAMCMGNGIVFIFLLAIPIIGVFIAPPLATIAGTLQAHRHFEANYVEQ